jgi:SnoaL-like domain
MTLVRYQQIAAWPVTVAACLSVAGSLQAQNADDRIAKIEALESRLASLRHRVELLEDTKAIKRLQRAYGYYLDKRLSGELAKLFADDPTTTVEYGNAGVYVGKERIAAYLERLIGTGPSDGELFNHMLLQGVVHVAPDGMTAKGRWRALIQVGELGESAAWAEGPYENEYVKEDGVWKFHRIHWYQTMAAPYAPGWHKVQTPMMGIDDDFPPDLPPTVDYESYPGAYLPPYHYANPVSGRCEKDSCDG